MSDFLAYPSACLSLHWSPMLYFFLYVFFFFNVREAEIQTLAYLLFSFELWHASSWRSIGSLATHKVHSEDAQADLSLHWAHRSFCWFCHAVAHFRMLSNLKVSTSISFRQIWQFNKVVRIYRSYVWQSSKKNEPAHQIMAFFVLRKIIPQTACTANQWG